MVKSTKHYKSIKRQSQPQSTVKYQEHNETHYTQKHSKSTKHMKYSNPIKSMNIFKHTCRLNRRNYMYNSLFPSSKVTN